MKVISGGNHSFIITENMKISNNLEIYINNLNALNAFQEMLPIEGPLIIRPDVNYKKHFMLLML